MICFGINPSTAEPNNLDPTLTRVSKYAITNGFDSWIMLNIYPQRQTNPQDMHSQLNEEWHKENVEHISNLLAGKNYTIWAAWGENIAIRPYLMDCLKSINEVVQSTDCRWYALGQSEKQHPFHPLYRGRGFRLYISPLLAFDIKDYTKG
ncbi:hypothetical protein FACS1894104_0570 [Actinomycetota bacterium]|nr:hypothetical protein FACS1894104_0570 [Actinomycetota bacterium]